MKKNEMNPQFVVVPICFFKNKGGNGRYKAIGNFRFYRCLGSKVLKLKES